LAQVLSRRVWSDMGCEQSIPDQKRNADDSSSPIKSGKQTMGALTDDSSSPIKSDKQTSGARETSMSVIKREKLFVSEPDPLMFGNNRNTPSAPGWTNQNWLRSMFHFSFAEYRNGPSPFGVLRVMNDDLVQPGRGFGTHPHRDMEIVTYILEGSLTHKDSTGTEESLGRGSVQFMTAGTGVRHSEQNRGKQPCRFIQSWVVPRRRGLPPNYGSLAADAAVAAARRNRWAHLVSDVAGKLATPVQINQDCNMYVIELAAGVTSPPFELTADRQAYMLCAEGSIKASSGVPDEPATLRRHDAAELKGPISLNAVAGAEGGFLLVFEMAATRGRR